MTSAVRSETFFASLISASSEKGLGCVCSMGAMSKGFRRTALHTANLAAAFASMINTSRTLLVISIALLTESTVFLAC